MGKRTGKADGRARDLVVPTVLRPRVQQVPGPVTGAPVAGAPVAGAPVTGAPGRAAKKCCRSTPRCKRCPVVLMRAARLEESGLSGKELKKAVKRARAA